MCTGAERTYLLSRGFPTTRGISVPRPHWDQGPAASGPEGSASKCPFFSILTYTHIGFFFIKKNKGEYRDKMLTLEVRITHSMPEGLF